jgi:Ca-activated chloride channel family protein
VRAPTSRALVSTALACLALSALAQSPSPSPAPSASPKPFTLEVEVYVVSVTAVVFDKSGHFVKGLGAKDVTLLEDGVKQDLTYFREAAEGTEKIPLSVVLVLDASGSMKPNLRFLQEAASSFIQKLEEVDSALVVQFNDTIKGSAEFTDDTDRLEQFIDALQAWGGTSLFDAVHYALGRVKDQPGRKAVVVFTDGADTTSRMSEQETVDYAKSVEATVYGIGFSGGPGGSSRGFLKKISSETGGEFFAPSNVADLVKIFGEISKELHNHYAFAYSPIKPPDGSWRTIQVKVDRKDTEVRVRKGYFAVKRRRPKPAKPAAP